VFSLLMLGCSVAKDRMVERWRQRRESRTFVDG